MLIFITFFMNDAHTECHMRFSLDIADLDSGSGFDLHILKSIHLRLLNLPQMPLRNQLVHQAEVLRDRNRQLRAERAWLIRFDYMLALIVLKNNLFQNVVILKI